MLEIEEGDLPEEDLLGLAGWMYADLFLALMVIFLATISFIPSLIHNPVANPQAQKPVANTANHFKALSMTYEGFDIATIEKDIYDFQFKEGLQQGTPVIYAQIIAGYNPGSESPNDAAIRALLFSTKLESSSTGMFKRTSTNLDSSNSLKANEIAVVFTFGPRT